MANETCSHNDVKSLAFYHLKQAVENPKTADCIYNKCYGKFEIRYNYSKPEDYEETCEVITGNETNQTF